MATTVIPFVKQEYQWIPAVIGGIGLALLGGTARDNSVRSSQVPAINPALKEQQEELKEKVADQFKAP